MSTRLFTATLFTSLLSASFFSTSVIAAEPSIRVTGDCKRKVYPDEEIYQLSFLKTGKDNRIIQEEISKRANKLIDELKKDLGKKIELRTQGFQSYPQYQWIKGQNVFQGFQAKYSLEIKLTDFSKREELQKISRASGAEEWSGPTHQLSDALKLKERDLCLSDAIENARAKALIIAKTANVNLQGLISASEIQGGFHEPAQFKGAMAMSSIPTMEQMTAPNIEVQEMDYQMTLEVTYSFK